jgi:hypothetical protein
VSGGGWLCGLLLAWSAQVGTQGPARPPTPPPMAGTDEYGEPEFVDLTSIANFAQGYQRRHVQTRGKLALLGISDYFELTDGAARVLVILESSLSPNDLRRLVGFDLDVRGIVRAIRPKEYIQGVDKDLIEDRSLPVLPAPRIDLPQVSITVLSFSERDARSPRGRNAPGTRGMAAEVLADPGASGGKPVRIVGLFRGRNLFGDLPAASQRDKADWVLKDEDTAFWVTGKEPRGKGWSLDPDLASDTARWIEVEGRPEVANGVLYLRATKLRLTKPPGAPAGDDGP